MKESVDCFDVTIIGGGAIGALFALSLAYDSHDQKAPAFKIALVDQNPLVSLLNPHKDGRTFALTQAAFDLLQKLGIWEKLEPFASPILNIFVTEGKSQEGIHYDHESLSRPFGYIVESSLLRKEIFSKLHECPDITCLTPFKFSGLEKQEGSLKVFLEDEKTLQTRLLVGADGRSSKVRSFLKFETFHFPYPQDALVCHFSHAYPHRGWANEAFYPEGPFAVLPLKGNADHPHQSGLVWTDTPAEISRLAHLDIEDFNQALTLKIDEHRYGKPFLLSPRWTYPLAAHVAPTIIKERVVLLGDAAHGIHPVAGQGLNLGIRDVENLSSEISKALSLGLDPGAFLPLQNFQKSRRIDVLILLGVTHGLIRLFSNQSRILKFLRHQGLIILDEFSLLKKFLIHEAMGKK